MLRSNAPGALMPSRFATRVATFGQRSTEEHVATTTRSMSAAVRPEPASAFSAAARGHVGHRLVGGRDAALGDADPVADPGVVGVDHLGQVVVGQHPRRLVVAEAEHARSVPPRGLRARFLARRWCSRAPRAHDWASDAGEGLARADRVVVVSQPLDELAGVMCGHLGVALPGDDVPEHLAGFDLISLDEIGQRFEGTADGGDREHERHRRFMARRHAVAGDEIACGGQVVRRVHRDDLGALQLPLGQSRERAGRRKLDDAGDAEIGRVSMHRSQRTGAVT